MKFNNLYYNLLPIISPKEKNVKTFLDKAIFCKPNHKLSPDAETLLVEYEVFALTRFIDRTQKPYFMAEQLNKADVDTYLLEGTHDLLFPYEKSIGNSRRHLKRLKEVKVFENVGHGIETYHLAIKYVGDTISNLSKSSELYS